MSLKENGKCEGEQVEQVVLGLSTGWIPPFEDIERGL